MKQSSLSLTKQNTALSLTKQNTGWVLQELREDEQEGIGIGLGFHSLRIIFSFPFFSSSAPLLDLALKPNLQTKKQASPINYKINSKYYNEQGPYLHIHIWKGRYSQDTVHLNSSNVIPVLALDNFDLGISNTTSHIITTWRMNT